MKAFEDILKILYRADMHLKPCKEWQVKSIEKEFNLSLPGVYREFLLNMGKGAGDFMRGSSCFYNEIFFLRNWAIGRLEENQFRNLPDNSFVFWMHQGYQFAFFLLDGNNNPPVYCYTEVDDNNGSDDFIVQNSSLTEFYYDELRMSGILS